MAGPLQGLKLIEIAGIGPAPFAAMMLADLGVEVVPASAARQASSEGSRRRSESTPTRSFATSASQLARSRPCAKRRRSASQPAGVNLRSLR